MLISGFPIHAVPAFRNNKIIICCLHWICLRCVCFLVLRTNLSIQDYVIFNIFIVFVLKIIIHFGYLYGQANLVKLMNKKHKGINHSFYGLCNQQIIAVFRETDPDRNLSKTSTIIATISHSEQHSSGSDLSFIPPLRKMNEPKHELEVKETLSLPIFWKVFFLFSFALAPVLTALTTFKVYGQSFIHDDMFLAKVGGSLGIAKGLGAFSWGVVADFMYLEGLVLVMTIIVTLATVFVYISSFYGRVLYVVAFVTLFLAGGGIFSLYPVVLVRYFGRNNFATIYGIGLTSIAVAAAFMALVTLSYGRLYRGWFIFWLSLAFIASLAVWIALYLHLLDYRGVNSSTVTDSRTVDQGGQEVRNVERNVPPVQREQIG